MYSSLVTSNLIGIRIGVYTRDFTCTEKLILLYNYTFGISVETRRFLVLISHILPLTPYYASYNSLLSIIQSCKNIFMIFIFNSTSTKKYLNIIVINMVKGLCKRKTVFWIWFNYSNRRNGMDKSISLLIVTGWPANLNLLSSIYLYGSYLCLLPLLCCLY